MIWWLSGSENSKLYRSAHPLRIRVKQGLFLSINESQHAGGFQNRSCWMKERLQTLKIKLVFQIFILRSRSIIRKEERKAALRTQTEGTCMKTLLCHWMVAGHIFNPASLLLIFEGVTDPHNFFFQNKWEIARFLWWVYLDVQNYIWSLSHSNMIKNSFYRCCMKMKNK